MVLKIDSSAAVSFTNKLEKLHRSALPNAIRGALNKAAFDVKQRTMLQSAERTFIIRQKNFFKANSRVDMATGWNVNQMQSTVGFVEQGLSGENNYAVDDLEQQERGGTIHSRSFVPTDVARGGSNAKPVRPGNRLSGINKIVNSNHGTGTRKERFIKAAVFAGVGGYVIGNSEKKILWRIDAITKRGAGVKIRMKPIYSFEENRDVKVKATGFMRTASLESGSKMDDFYIQEAKRQIEKLMNK